MRWNARLLDEMVSTFSWWNDAESSHYLVISILFFLLAAIARAALVWTIFSADLGYVDISIRTVAFVFLLLALMRVLRDWANLGKPVPSNQPKSNS